MEHAVAAYSKPRLCVLAKLDLVRLLASVGGHAFVDQNSTSKLILFAYDYSNELVRLLIKIN